MARTNFTFTFTNAQPGSPVTFSYPVYADGSTTVQDGPQLILDANKAVSVWADSDYLIAVSTDGNGLHISGTATKAAPSVTVGDGTAPTNPFGSGGSSAGGDFATWHRATTVDATSGAFDYAADLTGSSGTSIAVDDSTDWITNFGWPVPKVTVSGVYTVVCRVSKAGSNAQVQVGLYNASGVQTGPFMPAAGGNQLADIEADASGQAVVMFTTYLAAGTHISVDTVQPSDPDALNLAIQRCA